MERTADFVNLIHDLQTTNQNFVSTLSRSPKLGPSPFILRAADMLAQLVKIEDKIDRVFEDYIDFHRHLEKFKSSMQDIDRAQLDKEIAIFVATFVTEVHDLKRNEASANEISSVKQHRVEVVSYLLERVNVANKKIQKMQKQRQKYSRNPFRLITGRNNNSLELDLLTQKEKNKDDTKDGKTVGDKSKSIKKIEENKNELKSQTSVITSKIASNLEPTLLSSSSINNTKSKNKQEISSNFAERYESEIGSLTKMKEYNLIASKHKVALLKETKQLQTKFSEERLQAINMEHTVSGISKLLDEFVHILQYQSEHVQDIYDTSKLATQHVTQTSDQLLLTIERSQSYRRNMVTLIIGLAILLLFLDFITP